MNADPNLDALRCKMRRFFTERNAWVGLVGIFGAFFFAALLAHAYIGSFSRFISDDYCTAAALRSHGFFGAQKNAFETWAGGRFSFTLTMSLAHLIGSRFVPFIPGIVLSLWLVALTWTLSQPTGLVLGPQMTVARFLLAEMIILSALTTSPALYQSLYWETGAITYVVPLILMTIYIGMLFRMNAVDHPLRLTPAIFIAGLAFVAAGFSETYAALQMGGLLLALFGYFFGDATVSKRRVLPLLIGGLLGSVLSAIIFVLAPGNEARIADSVRQATTPAPQTLLSFLKLSLRFGLDSVFVSLSSQTTMAVTLILPALLAVKLSGAGVRSSGHPEITLGKLKTVLVVIPIAGFVLIVLSFMPSAYVAAYLRGGYHPQPRLAVTAQFIFFCSTCFWSFLAGTALRQSRLLDGIIGSQYLVRVAWIVAALLLVVPIHTLRQTLALRPTVQTYASFWDDQERQIHAARLEGARKLTVRAVPATGRDSRGNLYFDLRLMDSNPNNWVNGCAAEYYAVDSIVAK